MKRPTKVTLKNLPPRKRRSALKHKHILDITFRDAFTKTVAFSARTPCSLKGFLQAFESERGTNVVSITRRPMVPTLDL